MAEMAKVATADTMVSAKKDAPMAGDSIMSPTNHSTWSMSLLYSLLIVLVRLAFRPKSSKLQSKLTLLTCLQLRLTMKVSACVCNCHASKGAYLQHCHGLHHAKGHTASANV